MVGAPNGAELSRPGRRVREQDRAVVRPEAFEPRMAAPRESIVEMLPQWKAEHVHDRQMRREFQRKVERTPWKALQVRQKIERAPPYPIIEAIRARKPAGREKPVGHRRSIEDATQIDPT